MMIKLSRSMRVGLVSTLLVLLQSQFLASCSFAVMEAAGGKSTVATPLETKLKVLSASRDEQTIHTCIEVYNSKSQARETYTLVIPRWDEMPPEELKPYKSAYRYHVRDYHQGCEPLPQKVPVLDFKKGDMVDLGFNMQEAIYVYQDEWGWALGYLQQGQSGAPLNNVSLTVNDLPVLKYYRDKKPYLLLLLPVTVPLDMAGIVAGGAVAMAAGGVLVVGFSLYYPILIIQCSRNNNC